ncbi:MAG: adenylate/guanylate cyclase domain-containing protein [Alphaproteobacteria bacterium]
MIDLWLIANFRTPKYFANDTQNTFYCTAAMNIKFKNFNKKQANQFIIKHRIGVHYGTYVAGNMRSKHRFAVIGDAVNMERRVLAKDLIQIIF